MDDAQPMRRKSLGMMVTGIVLTGTGGAAVLIGGITLVQTALIGCDPCSWKAERTAGAVAMITGGVALLVGLPMIFEGNEKVPVTAHVRSRAVAVGPPVLHLGPGTAAISLSF